MDFTVAIPTFNGASRVPFVLDRLREQQDLQGVQWEVIVVDNNSTDQIKAIVETYQQDFPCPLRYCFEEKQGAGYARKLAIREAQSELIGFLDDDNILNLNWIKAAIDFAREHPQAGAIGSQIHGDFEVEPAPELKPLLPFLAICEWGNKPFQYDRMLPPSAGLVIRRQAWLENVPEHTILGGRIEGNTLTGEDLEAIAYIQRKGKWEIWYNPAMEVDHKISHWRLTREYLIPFFRGIGLSRSVTRTAGIQEWWKRSFLLFAYCISDFYKIVLHILRSGYHARSSIVAACELELLLSSLMSPFYLYRKGYFRTGKALMQKKKLECNLIDN